MVKTDALTSYIAKDYLPPDLGGTADHDHKAWIDECMKSEKRRYIREDLQSSITLKKSFLECPSAVYRVEINNEIYGQGLNCLKGTNSDGHLFWQNGQFDEQHFLAFL